MVSTQSISVSPFPPARRSGPPRYHLGPVSRSTSSSRLEVTQGGPHRGDIGGSKMQILIVGIGALGGTIAARAIRTGLPVRLAARNTDSAEALRRSGLRVSDIGGPSAEPGEDELSEGVGPASATPSRSSPTWSRSTTGRAAASRIKQTP